ncbi:MAG TPA: hypothetical protein PL033_01855 [Candidatus Brocadiia bacterium]|nr:hypothetical protein [Candidatus Brocadiia bacterium]
MKKKGINRAMTLLMGKIRRQVYINLRRKKAEECISSRQGECLRCATCCRLLFRCPFLGPDNLCAIYKTPVRPRTCQMFPITERDLDDARIVSGGTPCGYRFNAENPCKSADRHGASAGQ